MENTLKNINKRRSHYDITLIITFFNEERYLQATINSLKDQDLGKYCAEVLLIDGLSTDNSRGIADSVINTDGIDFIVLENPKRITPSGLNIGLSQARSDIIGFGGAHAIYPKNYLRRSIELIQNNGNDAVGGRCEGFTTFDNGLIAKSMTLLYMSPLGAGARSLYRERGPAFVKTVFGGIFKREVFEKCGGYDENLARGQDIDFNTRAINAGFKILYHPDLNTISLVRTEPFAFLRRAFMTGSQIANILGKRSNKFSFHYLAPVALVNYLIVMIICIIMQYLLPWILIPFFVYLFLLIFSAMLLISKATVTTAMLSIPLFFIYHLVYGIGTIKGYLSYWRKKITKWSILKVIY